MPNISYSSKKYHYPRCGNEKIIEYEKSFDCTICKLEFEKKDCDQIDDDSKILLIEEKEGIYKALDIDPKNPESIKNFSDESNSIKLFFV